VIDSFRLTNNHPQTTPAGTVLLGPIEVTQERVTSGGRMHAVLRGYRTPLTGGLFALRTVLAKSAEQSRITTPAQ
jgi:hypothetical protein